MVNMDSGLSRIARPGMTKRGTNGDQKENQGQIEGGGKKVREKSGETQIGKKTANESRGWQWRAAAVDQSVGPSRPGARRRQDSRLHPRAVGTGLPAAFGLYGG